MNALIEQGIRAWKCYENYHGCVPTQPSMSESQVVREHGDLHIVLANCNGILAVYRVRDNGTLYRCKRVPQHVANLYDN